jgi:hypothetical protein
MWRGSILSWHVSVPGEGGLMIKAPDASDILRLLTYWDRIFVPMPAIREVLEAFRARVPDRELLIQEGILEEEECSFQFMWDIDYYRNGYGFEDLYDRVGGYRLCYVATLLADLPYDSLAKLSAKYPRTAWSVTQPSMTDLRYPPARFRDAPVSAEMLSIDLLNALPVPAPSTPVEVILQFREKRKDELLAFRQYFDDLADKVLRSENPVQQAVRASENLELALLDLHRAMDHSRIKRATECLRTYVSLGQPAAPAMVTATVAAIAASPKVALCGALAGLATNAALTFRLCRNQVRNVPETLRDVAYLYYVDRGRM